jgi:hypothetical protein
MALNVGRRQLLNESLQEGLIVTRKWLLTNGFSKHALDNQVKSKQLKVVAKGVYALSAATLTWQSVVCSLQSLLNFNLTVGGLTALELQGLSHYLALSAKRTIHLYGTDKLPAWTNTLLSDVTFIRHSEQELLGRSHVKHQQVHKKDSNLLSEFTIKQTWRAGIWPLILSSQERACLEVLMHVPKSISFEHADQLMQGLTSLSPRKLQLLLKECQNIKVRRLFFWLAERQRYPWLDKLNPDAIDFGSGKRMLVKGGKLDPKYNITVPGHL